MDVNDNRIGESKAEEIKRKLNSEVRWNTPFSVPDFVTPKLDFDLDTNHFMRWLKAEEQEVTGIYKQDCTNMCEYSCLYISMLLYDMQLEGELRVICGQYGFWGHYWMEYTIGDNVYFIDITLKQFVPQAPKISITEKHNDPRGYNVMFEGEGEEYRTYVDRVMGFEYYENPTLID